MQRRSPQGWVTSIAIYLYTMTFGLSCAMAQDSPEVQAIRTEYNALNKGIALCGPNNNEWCGYFVNTLLVNRYDGPWPDVGVYLSTQQFFGQLIDVEDGTEVSLRKIEIKTDRSKRKETEEFLFDAQGRLIFYFFMTTEEGATLQEFRFYFAEGRLLDYKEKIVPEEMDYRQYKRSDFADILKDAQSLVAAYHSSFR